MHPTPSSPITAHGRRRALQALAAAAALAASGTAAWAQSRTIRLLVGFPAGGGSDAVARLIADKLHDELPGSHVIVENKPGAGGQLAAQALKAATPDGTTLMLSHDHTISILPLVTKSPGFDPARDFVPVAGFASFANALAVGPGQPAHTLKEYLAGVRAAGGKANIGVPAPASVPEFLVRLIGEREKLDLQAVPYRGSQPMLTELMGGQIPAAVASVPELVELHKTGKLRVVGVLGKERQALLPDVPTFAELGLSGFEDLPYYGIFAPTGTPHAEVDRLGAAVLKVIAQPAVRERLVGWGMTVQPMTAAQLGARERAYTAAWSRIVKERGFAPL